MTISGVVSLTRPMMLPTALADAFLGTGCAGLVMGSVIGWKTFAIACAIAVLLYAAGIVLNDIADVKADRLEACERPLADRTTSILSAVALFMLLAGTALLMAAMRGNTTLILALACFSVAGFCRFWASNGVVAAIPIKRTTPAVVRKKRCIAGINTNLAPNAHVIFASKFAARPGAGPRCQLVVHCSRRFAPRMTAESPRTVG